MRQRQIALHPGRNLAQPAADLAVLVQSRRLTHSDDQIHLGGEVMQHGTAAYARLLHDQLRGGRRIADAAQTFDRGVDQLLAHLGAAFGLGPRAREGRAGPGSDLPVISNGKCPSLRLPVRINSTNLQIYSLS